MASNDLAVRADTGIVAEQTDWSPEQRELLAAIGCAARTEGELQLFLHQCKRTGLDPFTRQIHMVNYGGNVVTQTGIDGFRVIARRAADAAGEAYSLTATEWCGPDGVWTEVWLSDEPPAAARVSVVRGGQMFPAVAMYREYVARKKDGSVNAMWKQRPAGQLAKCAEALAYRRAFPQDLAGLYSDDEMEQARNPVPRSRTEVKQIPQTATDFMKALKLTGDEFKQFTGRVLKTEVGVWVELTDEQRAAVLAAAAEWLDTGADPTAGAAESVDVVTGEIIEQPAAQTTQTAPANAPQHPEPHEAATQGQVGSIQAHMRRLEIDDRGERLYWTATLADISDPSSLESSKDLTAGEAGLVLDRMTKIRSRAELESWAPVKGDPS